MKPKVFVIGLDGATFDLIKPWIKEGRLPNIKKLMGSGVYGNLISTIPPETPPAWMSFVTGKHPCNHGIVDFEIMRNNHSEKSLVTSRDRDSDAIWNILSRVDKKVGIVTVPVTYPPEKVNGFMISGLLTPPGRKDITYPPELGQEIINSIGNCRPYFKEFKFGKDNIIREVYEYTDEKVRVISHLLKRYSTDFFMTVFMGLDVVHHIFWKYMDRSHPEHDERLAKRYGGAILKAYQMYDEVIGDILNDLDKDATIIVASDHGAGPLHKIVYINKWLEDIGMLKLKTKSKLRPRYWVARMDLSYKSIENFFLSDSRLLSSSMQRLLFKFRSLIPRRLVSKLRHISPDIDWHKTKAYSFGDFGQINVNLKGREPKGIVEPGKEYEEARNYLIRELNKLEDSEAGGRVVDNVFRREELFSGKYFDRAPDIYFTMKDMKYSTWRTSEFGKKKFDNSNISSVHRMNGILIMKGPNIKKGVKIKNAEIIDLAPTILHIFGLPVPGDMDGKVLEEAFESS